MAINNRTVINNRASNQRTSTDRRNIHIYLKLLLTNTTQQDLAKKFNVSRQSINNVLSGGSSLILEEKLYDWLYDHPKYSPETQYEIIEKCINILTSFDIPSNFLDHLKSSKYDDDQQIIKEVYNNAKANK